jgi:citrate lyase beta subunit
LIDTEDAIDNLEQGLKAIKELLLRYEKKELLIFIRPKNIETLQELLFYDGILNIDGFILPKFSLQNAQEYLDILEPFTFFIMPSIEGKELFNHTELNQLKEILLKSKLDIQLIRFGLEDMLRQLSMTRSCKTSPFDIGATSQILGNFIATFKSAGFIISGGVFPCFKDDEGFTQDIKRDLKEGLFSKTIIHPNHIELVNELYKVTQEEFNDAMEIFQSDEVVFAQKEKMAEVITALPYAKEIILRAEVYGIQTQ